MYNPFKEMRRRWYQAHPELKERPTLFRVKPGTTVEMEVSKRKYKVMPNGEWRRVHA